MANKYLAAVLSFFIPGLGQTYAGNIKKGISYFVFAVIMMLCIDLIHIGWIYYSINLLISFYAAYDAYVMVA